MIHANDIIKLIPTEKELEYYRLKIDAEYILRILPKLEAMMLNVVNEGKNYLIVYTGEFYSAMNLDMLATYLKKFGYRLIKSKLSSRHFYINFT